MKSWSVIKMGWSVIKIHKITIRWGKDPEYWHVKEYVFGSKAELEAFKHGVDEAYDRLDYEILS